MAGTLGNLLMFRRHRAATAGHAGHGPGTPRPAAMCCPVEQPMPAAGRNRVGNAGVVADLPITPSNRSLSLSSGQKCDSDHPGPPEKANDKAEELAGKAKATMGDKTDNPDLETEGRMQEANADVNQAGENVRDSGDDVTDALRSASGATKFDDNDTLR